MCKLPHWLAPLLLLALFAPPLTAMGDEAGPVYQQRSTHMGHGWRHSGNRSRNAGHWRPSPAPAQQPGSFQRPYPYHLDYYRMRYGGSYAPYFGNLYGPPQVYAPTSIQGSGYGFGGGPGYGVGVPHGVSPGQPATYGQPAEVPAGIPSRPSRRQVQ